MRQLFWALSFPRTPKFSMKPKKKTKRKRSKTQNPRKIKTLAVAAASTISPRIAKYYRQRYSLFSKYDAGVQLDEEGWFSVTPEPIAARHASHTASHSLVVDCFSGVGGNAIQFAASKCHVIAVEIDAKRVEFAANNAKIYGVEDYIDFVIGDFFQLAPHLQGDCAFLSPPWGGPSYSDILSFTLDMLKPKDGYSIFQAAQIIAPNIIMFLPRNMDLNQVAELSWLSSPPLNLMIEVNHVQTRMKGITAYFGDTASALPGDSRLLGDTASALPVDS